MGSCSNVSKSTGAGGSVGAGGGTSESDVNTQNINGNSKKGLVIPKTYVSVDQKPKKPEEEQKQEEQKPTNARVLHKMNEAQLKIEIQKSQDKIAAYNRQMGINDITNTSESNAMREAFPLGVGGSGWSAKSRNAVDRRIESDLRKSGNYTQAYRRRELEQNALKNLQSTLKAVQGTGKTLEQIWKEKEKAEKAAKKAAAKKKNK